MQTAPTFQEMQKTTIGSKTKSQRPLLALLSTQMMRLNPITNYMRPCHHALNTIDTIVFPCTLFAKQSSNHSVKVQQTKPTTIQLLSIIPQPTSTRFNLNTCHVAYLLKFSKQNNKPRKANNRP